MVLPEPYELQFEQAVKAFEETDKMRYVTTIERRAIQRGLEQGIEQGILQKGREDLLEILIIRFEHLPQPLVDQINNLTDINQLKRLLKQAVLAPSLAEFQQGLAAQEHNGHSTIAQS
jgi:hypothetical protein